VTLSLVGVRVAHGAHEVLHGVDLAVARDELLVVLGPSGAGKSTLLRAVAGLTPVSAGRVAIRERDVTRLRPGQRNVAMVFQSYALFPHLTAAENIAFGLIVRDVPKAQAAERARRAAATVGCGHLLDRRPGQLSGGERQRVALARALVREPDVFLLDEPLSNLDAELRVEMRAELKALHARVGGATLHVTHDQVEALVLGDRIAVLRDGRIEQVGTPDQIWHTPSTTFVARFVGSPPMNLLPSDGPLPGLAPAGTLIGVRPAAIHLTPSAGPWGTAVVERVEVVGEDAHVYLRLGEHALVARMPTSDRPSPGAEVHIDIRPQDIHVFDATTGKRA
jgi:ABC-type sugar transport system ATPase subunit